MSFESQEKPLATSKQFSLEKRGREKVPRSHPTNIFGLFLKNKKLTQDNFDFKTSCEEWKSMTAEEKELFGQQFQTEKVLVNDDQSSSTCYLEPSKNSAKKKGPKVKKVIK